MIRACVLLCLLCLATPLLAGDTEPLVIGDTFTLESAALGETRRINVYTPAFYGQTGEEPLPVLYMPDGGLGEDFLHIAGLVQISVLNGTMRPFLLVGIENTERRRDLTGPTQSEEDRTIAPRVGGSAHYRAFIRDELMPVIRGRYATSDETALIGESLAGLFVVETLLLEPALFTTYIAIDPSLWWDDERLVNDAAALLRPESLQGRSLYLAVSGLPEFEALVRRFSAAVTATVGGGLDVRFTPMPDETHGTIYHPAALAAVRAVFAPVD